MQMVKLLIRNPKIILLNWEVETVKYVPYYQRYLLFKLLITYTGFQKQRHNSAEHSSMFQMPACRTGSKISPATSAFMPFLSFCWLFLNSLCSRFFSLIFVFCMDKSVAALKCTSAPYLPSQAWSQFHFLACVYFPIHVSFYQQRFHDAVRHIS